MLGILIYRGVHEEESQQELCPSVNCVMEVWGAVIETPCSASKNARFILMRTQKAFANSTGVKCSSDSSV